MGNHFITFFTPAKCNAAKSRGTNRPSRTKARGQYNCNHTEITTMANNAERLIHCQIPKDQSFRLVSSPHMAKGRATFRYQKEHGQRPVGQSQVHGQRPAGQSQVHRQRPAGQSKVRPCNNSSRASTHA